jgi:DNA replication protein
MGDNLPMLGAAMLEAGSIVVPDLLIKFYSRLGLTEIEMMVLIHLLHWRQIEQERFPAPEKISQYMGLDSEAVKNIIAAIIEKKLLAVEPYYHSVLSRWQNTFSFAPLWSRLTAVALGDSQPVPASTEGRQAADPRLGQLYRNFEKEFGRPLSPLESDQLKAWCQNDRLPVDLLQEALRRAVLRGILNFRYIDSILRDWQRHNIHTVAEAAAYDEELKTKKNRSPRSPQPPARKDKYRELYRLNP